MPVYLLSSSRLDDDPAAMVEMLTAHLPGSWLVTRMGADRHEIERCRRAGELFAVPGVGSEWLYSAWQFGPRGEIPLAVRDAVKAAKEAGLTETRLIDVPRLRTGLMGGGRLFDLLFEGRAERVVAEIRAAAA
jgi:hypothetical protein